MDNIKTNIAKRVEKILNYLNEPSVYDVANANERFNLLSRIYAEIRPEMVKNKKYNRLEKTHDEYKTKIQDELKKLSNGIKGSQFMVWCDFWEQELLNFYRDDFKDVEFTYEAM